MSTTPEQQRALAEDPRSARFPVAFGREGYSRELFRQLWERRMAILTDHKFPQGEWRSEEFATQPVVLSGGETVSLRLAERETQLSNGFRVREIRKRSDSGHPASILTSNFRAPVATVAPRRASAGG